jgi:hypothetical protein
VSIAALDGSALVSDAPVSAAHIGFGELPEAYEAALQSMKHGTALAHVLMCMLRR